MTLMQRVEQRIWHNDNPKKWERILRTLLAVWRVVNQSQIKLFATSLTYHTLLAIVPLLAVLFTLLKSFNVDQFLQKTLQELLAPMGETAHEISIYLSEFVSNAQTGLLGGIGLLFLFYSIFALFRKIEAALNHLWCVDNLRNFKNQLVGYLGAILLTVVVASAAIGLNVFAHQILASEIFSENALLNKASTYGAKILSIIVTAVMLMIVYSATINTSVSLRASFIGGVFCAVLWIPLTMGFSKIMALSSSYSIVYSGFAGLIILLIWLQILWMLFLSGGLVAYFIQFPRLLRPNATTQLNPAELEYYAKQSIGLIITSFRAGHGAVSLWELIEKTQLSHRQMLKILLPFVRSGVIVPTGQSRSSYLLAKDSDSVTETFILQTIRGEVRATGN